MGDCVDVASVKVRTENWKKIKYSDRSFVPRSEVVRIVSIKICKKVDLIFYEIL